ncbi:2-C-methyl-D-erythritol 4-phosphate cytidylyltransferase [Oikeobacillus pervagus]|nr:2-C-methyl-D-erythritol 4-phosphate cytidylyltransferase [Oikeobacillus pervagus]
MNYQVIIPAAGQGKRMKAGKNKLFIELNRKPIIIHTLEVFEVDPRCEGITLVVHQNEMEEFTHLLKSYHITKVKSLTIGGKERHHSVFNGLIHLQNEEIVLVHDGARPFIKQEIIHRLVDCAMKSGAAIVAVPVKDTIKKVKEGQIEGTIDRSSLWAAQTPQAFNVSILLDAYKKANDEQYIGTDEASLVERLSLAVEIVEGDYDNIKLTTPEDLFFAEAIMKKQNK